MAPGGSDSGQAGREGQKGQYSQECQSRLSTHSDLAYLSGLSISTYLKYFLFPLGMSLALQGLLWHITLCRTGNGAYPGKVGYNP